MLLNLRSSQLIYLGVCACFLLSGFAALLYQTAWMRQFSTVFGTSELAVATVLSAYMGGLALGAALAGKLIDRVKRPVLTYGVLEAAIAGSALLVPVLLGLAHWVYAQVLGGQPEPPDASGLGQSIFYFVVAFVVLAIPTACMGATLPLLTRYAVHSDRQIGSRVGALYAINTAGAVLGTLFAAFVLLPALGLFGTVCFGVAVNLLVFVLAVLIARRSAAENNEQVIDTQMPQEQSEEIEEEEVSDSSDLSAWFGPKYILPIMLVSGTTAFVYEVLWTRLLSHILGGSVAAFATMLASFLSGIAIGSAVASRYAISTQRSVRIFVGVQAAIAFTSMAIYQWLHLAIPAEQGLSGNIGIAIAILLPATLFIGATFPLAVRIFATSAARAANSSAQVYSWNTVGAIFGAAFAGFFLIPALKYEGAIKVVVLTNIFLGLITALIITRIQLWYSAVMAVLFMGMLFIYNPSFPEDILRTSPIDERAGGEIMYYEVGRSSTVLMTRDNGSIGLRNNGLPEAGTELRGSPPAKITQRALATLPALLRPDAKSMLIVGFGGGNAINGVPPTVDEIDVIELEPKVIEANRLAGEDRALDPLQDPRVSIYINDARSALSLTTKAYDAIISQPSHPWTAGASHLYTREYMKLAADHLTEDGVFLQWMGGQFITESLLRSLCATMLDVFAYVKVYQLFPEVLFFVGSQQPMNAEMEMAISGRPVVDAPAFYYQSGFASHEDLLAGLLLDTDGVREFSSGAKLLTDNFNRMATESAAVDATNGRLTVASLTELLQPYVPVLNPDSWVHQQMGASNFAYISDQFEKMRIRPYSIALAAALEEAGNPQSLLLTALGLEAQGDREESQLVLSALVAGAPEGEVKNQATYALIKPWLIPLMRGTAPENIQEAANSLTGSAAAVVAGRLAVAQQDWQRVAALDALLYQSRPTDLWFVDAIKVMSEWRNNLASIERRPDLALQSAQIIDLAIAIHPNPDLFSGRVSSAYFADRPEELLETIRRMTYIIESELSYLKEDEDPNNPIVGFRAQQVELIELTLNEVALRRTLNPVSLEEVGDRITLLKQMILEMAPI
jgi:spermidine synthase